MAIPSEFPFLYHGKEIMHSSCILDSVANLVVRHMMVFVRNVQKFPIASHLKGLDPFFDFCCQGPALTLSLAYSLLKQKTSDLILLLSSFSHET